MEKWTSRDEAQLKELADRKEKVMTSRREVVRRLILGMCLADTECDYQVEALASALINHADDVRDALLPFDSGHRGLARPVSTNIGLIDDSEVATDFKEA